MDPKCTSNSTKELTVNSALQRRLVVFDVQSGKRRRHERLTVAKAFRALAAAASLWMGGVLAVAQSSSVPLLADEQNTIQVFKQASPGVVHIKARLMVSSPFESRSIEESTGTGFLIDKAGRIVTAFHVVKDKDEIAITLSNRKRFDARLIGTAPQLDLALLQIDASAEDLVPLKLGGSESLQVGQKVIAIGNAIGLHNTLSVGVISAVQ
jgi:S1-C subfamily serine protease